ncbi:BrnT family toxin [Dyella nitratireducens]
MELEFDPAKAAANFRKHGISFAHAEQALRDPSAITIEDPDALGEQRFVSLGMDALGRILVIVHSQRSKRVRLISARKASPGEAAQYFA